MGWATLAASLLAPVAALVVFWAWLALQRARKTDPRRPLREASARLTATLAQLRSVAGSPTEADRLSSLLLEWQHDSAILLGIPHAAPVASHLAAAGDGWHSLWTEADRALYGAGRALPADWVGRAETALASSPPPPFAPWRLLLFRNLFPFVAALWLLSAAALATVRADETEGVGLLSGTTSYRQGDFPAAEDFWRREVKLAPTLPSAHYNLSLALAQQNRWDEAAAHAAAAFVQEPGNDAIRWQFALACEKAGYAPSPLVGFVTPGPVQRLARLAAPRSWQWTMIGASILFAAALGLALARAYRADAEPRRGARPSLVVAVFALLVLLAAAAGWRAYGEAADARAVVVWRTGILRSIPTEADVDQKTTPLAAGSVARANKSFLGWVRLSFANGETGWVRAEETVPLWGPLPR
jgi:hypothetical protein